jgi:hypothetical protein
MTKYIPAILLVIVSFSAFAQENEYRNRSNPLYWKNRMPDKAYWQQDVHYNISARIDEEKNIIEGIEALEYWNNSPDTLHYVFFHLFQNAFVKGSHLHSLELANKQKARLGKYEKQGLGITIEELTVAGIDANSELDNTVLKVYLPKPLYPGQKAVFSMKFKTYYDNGSTRRRMQMWDAWGFKHYNGTQWFPKICVYDRKFGWDTYQHLNREFYGDFGLYDVSLDFSSNYVVEATGVLQNRSEVLPDELRKKLDIKNFADKKWDDSPSIIIPYKKGERKIWTFKANNVHDFAFTADPSYRIGTAYWNGIECVALVQEPHASGWQNGAEYVAKIIKTFSEDVGMFQYPKMVAADARDGMEYPMLTLDGGRDPDYHGLLVHEIGHNWFYGQVGNNETYRAALDEGFTQFLTAWGLHRIDGDTMIQSKPKSKYKLHFYEPTNTEDRNVFNAYTFDALNRNELPLNTHSDDFHSGLNHDGGYRQVYYKTATMLYNLQYILGDSLFLAAFQNYFKQWRFAHPYFEDFRNSIIQFTNIDLNWFFDEWLETTKTIDYSICNIKKISGADSFAITLSRKGEMQMPIDLTVTAKNGNKYNYYIPNTWYEKKTQAMTLPKWYGWSKLHDAYTANVQIPSGISKVQIDTTYRLADVYELNNYKSKGMPIPFDAIKVKLDGGFNPPYDRRHYRAYVRPDLWWNTVDGIKLGAHMEGDYLFTMHRINASVWFNTHIAQGKNFDSGETGYSKYAPVNYNFNYNSPFNRNAPKIELQVNSRFLDGLMYHRAGFNWLPNTTNAFSLYGQTMWRPLSYDKAYLLYENEWSSVRSMPNSSLNVSWTHNYNYIAGSGNYKVSVRAPFLAGNSTANFNYAYVQLNAVNYNKLAKLQVRTRFFGRYGSGSNIPSESALFLAGANPEEMMDNKYTRSKGFVPESWGGISPYETNHFQQGGGLNLRGYAGYFIADERNGNVLVGYKSRSGIAGNLEVDFDDYIPLKPRVIKNILHVDAYAFVDAGVIELNAVSLPQYWNISPTTELSDLRVDAGVGLAFTIKNWGWFEKAKPLTIRFDMPWFINRPPYANPQYTNFRWVMGVNRTF